MLYSLNLYKSWIRDGSNLCYLYEINGLGPSLEIHIEVTIYIFKYFAQRLSLGDDDLIEYGIKFCKRKHSAPF